MVSIWSSESKIPLASPSAAGFKGVRVSKFRHVFGTGSRRECCYEGIRISRSAQDSQFCCVNPKFIAVVLEVAGGGAFQVVPIGWTGRVDGHFGRVSGHSGPVTEIKWNPFNDNVIASGSDDCTVKLWHIPDNGIKVCLNEWLAELSGHARKVSFLEWHPTAENLIATAALDHKVLLWDISTCQDLVSCGAHTDAVQSMSFNRIGNLLATTSKDKRIRVIDPRSGESSQETMGHEGAKAAKVAYLGDSCHLFTTGCSRTSSRQIALWDTRSFDKPVFSQDLDYSSGVLYPFYDADTGIMFVGGKGDGNIRYYEITSVAPYVHYISDYTSSSPQRGLGVMPKRGLKFSQCEIFRFYKLHATMSLVEPISFTVPRKSGLFQSDLFPPTPGPTPALRANEWICGLDKQPVMIYPKNGASVAVTNKPVSVKREPGTNQSVIVTADKNNERKFQFLSQVTRPDYRVITQRDDYPDIIKEQQLRHRMREEDERRTTQNQRRAFSMSPNMSDDIELLPDASGPDLSQSTDESTADGGPPAKSTRYPPAATGTRNPLRNGYSVGSEEFLGGGDRFSRAYTVSPRAYDSSPATPDVKSDSTDPFATPPEDPSTGSSAAATDASGQSVEGKHSKSAPTPKRRDRMFHRKPSSPPPAASMAANFLSAKSHSFISTTGLGHMFSSATKPGAISPRKVVKKPVAPSKSASVDQPTRMASPSSLPDEPLSPSLLGTNAASRSGESGSGSAGGSPSQRELELQKLYTAQCKNIRSLMDEKEARSQTVATLEQEVAEIRAKCRQLEQTLGQRDEEMECLRHEIAWKDSRIEELQRQMYKLMASVPDGAMSED